MKTHNINKFFKALTLALILLLVSNKMMGQAPNCTYTVSNPGPCAIVVTVQYYDNGNTLCLTAPSQGIPAAGSITLSCGSCSQPLANVVVTLISVNTNNLALGSSGVVDINNITNSGGITGTGCNGQTSYNMSWNNSETVIMY